MLDTLRRGTASWLAKGLLFLLILSFAVWGVADVFRGRGHETVATVGGTEVSTTEFQRAYQAQLEQLRRRFGASISSEQARAFGLDRQVLGQLVGAAVIEQHARTLGLDLSETTVADLVRNDPAFRGPDGQFNRIALESILREAGYNERSYLAARRRDEIREHITETLGAAATAPEPMIEVLHRYRDETRSVSHFNVDPGKVTIADPDETKLKETYEANKSRFVVPEYRRVAVLLLTLDRVAKSITVPEAEVRAAYEQGKDLYSVPERRRIEQIAFPDRASAEAARQAITGGQSFAEAAKAAGAKESDIDLGLLTRSQVIDPKIAEAAFALAKEQVSAVVEGRFATVLLRVTAIETGRQKPFEEVRAEIADTLARDKASEEIQKLHDLIDDQRAAGKPLGEIGAELKQPLLELAAVDRTGLTPDGQPALTDVEPRLIAGPAFEAAVGADLDAIEVGDVGYAWVRVLDVTPERQKAYEEVTAEVKTLWTEQERRRLVGELATGLAERVGKGEAMDALAAEAGGTLETTKSFKRFGAQAGLSEQAISQAFVTPLGRTATAVSKDGASRVVLRVDEVTVPPPPSREVVDSLANDVAQQMQGEVLMAYVTALQERLGVSINDTAFRLATGTNETQ